MADTSPMMTEESPSASTTVTLSSADMYIANMVLCHFKSIKITSMEIFSSPKMKHAVPIV